MRYYRPQPTFGQGYSDYFPSAVKWLLIANIAVFVLNFLYPPPFEHFKLFLGTVERGQPYPYPLAIWQLFTYLFLHGDLWHILFNMLALWMFGADLERTWGARGFLKYYFLCGVGAGVCVVAANYLLGERRPTIGASGAIFGLLLAFGMLFPNATVLFSFLFPIKAKYFVMIMGAIAFLTTLRPGVSPISNIAHLGGMIFGFLYLKWPRARRQRRRARIGDWYRRWKLQRAKKKFQVYLRKQQGDRDRWIH